MKKTASIFVLATLICTPLLFADSSFKSAEEGTVHITVVDANGTVVQEAPVYIYGEHKTHFVGGNEVAGTTTFAMKAGDYRISSAMVKKSGEYVDRVASNEAHVRIVPGDNVSVVLTLKTIDAAYHYQALSYAQLHVTANLFEGSSN